MDNKNIFESIVQVISEDESLSSKIAIKGGVALLLLGKIPNRSTKDLDLGIFVLDGFEESINTFCSKLIEKGFEVNKEKLKLIVVSDGVLEVEVSFHILDEGYKDFLVYNEGVNYFDESVIVLDKMDRFSRFIQQRQRWGDYYNDIGSIFKNNHERDLLDIYSLKDEILLNDKKYFEDLFVKMKGMQSNNETNYRFDSFSSMFSLFQEGVSYLMIENKKFIYGKYPITFKDFLLKKAWFIKIIILFVLIHLLKVF